ncbi:MAG: hypothetical protein ACTS4V_00280 [Candidatus Hodgkinia cicadicola]
MCLTLDVRDDNLTFRLNSSKPNDGCLAVFMTAQIVPLFKLNLFFIMVNKTASICKTLSKIGKTSCKKRLYVGKLVNGHVIAKDSKRAILNINSSKDAILFNNGSREFTNLSVGDWTKVYIEETDKDEDCTIVSRRKLDEAERWKLIMRLCKSGEEIKADIVRLTRKGIEMEVCGVFGIIFWTKELSELENEIRNRSELIVRVRATCKRYKMVIATLARTIEDKNRRKLSAVVWTNVFDLCDKGIWTQIDVCNGIIKLSGKPWCSALDVINQLFLGKLFFTNLVKVENAPKPAQSGDCIDLIVNFMLEIDESSNWDRNVWTIEVDFVWKWVNNLTEVARERWCEWRMLGIKHNEMRFGYGNLGKTIKMEISEEMNNEIMETNAKQNIIWIEEQVTLVELLCGFNFKRFELTKLAMDKVEEKQLSEEDKDWLRKVKNAWLIENKQLVTLKAKWWRELSLVWWKRTFGHFERKHLRFNWEGEIDYAISRELKDKKLIDKFWIQVVNKTKQIEGKTNEHKRNITKGNCGNNSRLKYGKQTEDVCNEDLAIKVETKLDDEWEKEWKLNREVNYWEKRYEETNCSLIETSYVEWRNVKVLRPVYAVIVGMETQTAMLMVAITKTMLAYVCDFSITDEDVTTLTTDWKNDLSLKVMPIALNFGLSDVIVGINVLGYKYLRFTEEKLNQSVIGIVAQIGERSATIELSEKIYGILRFNTSVENFGIEIGMEVDVTVVDFNPITDVINLELTEEEEVRTILIET